MASPEELADMFGVTDLTDIGDDVYEQYQTYERWMTEERDDHPTLSGGTWALIEESDGSASTLGDTGCDPGAPSLGHVRSQEEGR